MEIKMEYIYKEKMFHGEVDAKVQLDPGKGKVIIPEDFQNSTGQGPVQPGLHEMVTLLWTGTSTPSYSMIRKSN